MLWGKSALSRQICELIMVDDELLKWRFRRGSREAFLLKCRVGSVKSEVASGNTQNCKLDTCNFFQRPYGHATNHVSPDEKTGRVQ